MLKKLPVLFNTILLMYLLKQTDAGGACPDGWESIGMGCYTYGSSSYVNYDGAVTACSAIGGYPWVNNNYEETSAVLSSDYVRTGKEQWEYIWIGCTDKEVEGTFKCEDGSQFQGADVVWSGGWNSDTSRNCANRSPAFPSQAAVNIPCMPPPSTGYTYALCETAPLPPSRMRSCLYSLVKDEFGVTTKDRCLRGSVVVTITVKSKIQCARECVRNSECSSFNYKVDVCELNSGTKDDAPGNFEVDPGCSYYEPVYQNDEL
ncbi:uncharacterized protein [Diadema antillarum]|uniref:uncharacterized protein n=1 Tax=Diadema antillarum TaxID=105358 RepID=UPI003A83FFFE